MKKEMEQEHRVKISNPDGTETVYGPNEAIIVGKIYRTNKEKLEKDQEIELQTRELPPWRTVEKCKKED